VAKLDEPLLVARGFFGAGEGGEEKPRAEEKGESSHHE
jgi:hypothetical protein